MDNAAQTGEPTPQLSPEIAKQLSVLKSGANWFYWIAGLSLINSVINLTGGEWQFIIGLGVTQIVDGIASAASAEAVGDGVLVIRAVAFAINLIIALVVTAFGIFAGRGKSWAFLVGLILFVLDGLIFLMVQDWIGVGFHIFAAFCIFGGYKAIRRLRELEAQGQQPSPALAVG